MCCCWKGTRNDVRIVGVVRVCEKAARGIEDKQDGQYRDAVAIVGEEMCVDVSCRVMSQT